MATNKEKIEEVVEEPTMTQEEWLNERVPFRAIKDNNQYKDDIVVTINGKNWQIKRGVELMIPRFVYMAIIDAEDQKMVASTTSEDYENQYKVNTANNKL